MDSEKIQDEVDSSTSRGEESLAHLPPVDLSEQLSEMDAGVRAQAFRALPKQRAIEVFEYLPLEVQQELLEELGEDPFVRQVVDAMSPDDRAELFDELPEQVASGLLTGLSPRERSATTTLLSYEEGTAGRVMTTEYVSLRADYSVEQAISKIRLQDEDKETIYYAYVIDEARRLQGVVSLKQLLFSIPSATIRDVSSSKIIKASTDTPQEDIAQIMKRYDLIALPIVDEEERLVGIVTIDDVVDILEEEATHDIQRLAGVSGGDEGALSPPYVTIKKRLPWLLGNVGLYTGAASAIAPYQGTISAIPLLAVIMPILSNSSGNVAIQALTVTVRGLGVGEVTPSDTFEIVRKEVVAGLGTALGLGLALGILSLLWSDESETWVALVAGGVMAFNVLVAATLGTLFPMALKRLGLDPALISGPLLTTLLDAIGFFTFLTVTAFFLGA